MSTIEDLYTSTMLKQTGYLATWLPGTGLKLGLIGELQGKTFVPKSSIKTLGVEFKKAKDPAATKSMQFKSSDEIQVDTKLSGSVSTQVPSLPKAKAGAAVSFGRDAGVVFSARGVVGSRIEDIIALEDAIWDLWDRYLWDPDWVVIVELVTTERATVLVSQGGYAKVELEASADAAVGPVDLGDLSADMTVVSSHGMHTQLVGDEGLTPLFRAVRVKKGWFGGGKVVGIHDAAEAFAPGVVPRRGAERPEGSFIEDATD
ncbi:hypothetical protein [Kribbella monticola]|uniref:hypothetical protein n=1 Tax=Kribbella monticola TaxID=2185285 RepID=UPI001300975F|nr:hypothetical protein [Kribbella monticola]